MPTASQLVQMGYHGYAGWGDAEANADFNATGGRGKGGPTGAGNNSPAQSVNQAIEDSFKKLTQEVFKRFGEYKANHPFRIDEVLAQKAGEAKEQIDPYYNETLTNYLTGVNRRIERGTQDTKDLLAELQADTSSFERNTQLALQENINRAKEGFAGSGLYDSGARQRTEGLLQTENQNQTGDFMRKQRFRENQLNTGLSRELQDIGSQKQQQVRDIERSRYTDIEARKSQLAKEAGQQFVTGFRATLPPELQANSGFDLLQDLGVYT